MNYLVVVFLVLTPVAPAIFQVLATFVFPKFLMILQDMEVTPPAFTAYVISRANVFASVMTAAALLVYLTGILYLGGPRLSRLERRQRRPRGLQQRRDVRAHGQSRSSRARSEGGTRHRSPLALRRPRQRGRLADRGSRGRDRSPASVYHGRRG